MKTMTLIAVCALFSGIAAAQTYVKPHVTKNGTYVEGHVRSAPNSTNMDNYSTKGNTNPYTGQQGTAQPDYGSRPVPTYQQPSYGQTCGYTNAGRYVCQ